MKAIVEIVKIQDDVVTNSPGQTIASCTIPNQPVEECDFE